MVSPSRSPKRGRGLTRAGSSPSLLGIGGVGSVNRRDESGRNPAVSGQGASFVCPPSPVSPHQASSFSVTSRQGKKHHTTSSSASLSTKSPSPRVKTSEASSSSVTSQERPAATVISPATPPIQPNRRNHTPVENSLRSSGAPSGGALCRTLRIPMSLC